MIDGFVLKQKINVGANEILQITPHTISRHAKDIDHFTLHFLQHFCIIRPSRAGHSNGLISHSTNFVCLNSFSYPLLEELLLHHE